MASEEVIIREVCSILLEADLKARAIVDRLCERKIDVDRSALNSMLYRALQTHKGLSVVEGVWSYEPPKPAPQKRRARDRNGEPNASSAYPGGDAPKAVLRSESLLDFAPDEEQQRVIARPPDARVLVEAGPGTGKTAIACLRIARLVSEGGLNPSQLLLITFTRTAVAEIRWRLAHYLDPVAAAQVTISTIDSSAWRFERVAMDGSGELVTYDHTIVKAIELMKARDPSLMDVIESLEHLIVDEAQDVTGIRNDLVIRLVYVLSSSCGVTIFADRLQAIYGFTKDKTLSVGYDPVALFRNGLPKFEHLTLVNTHRFTPELKSFLSSVRTTAASSELSGVEKQREIGDKIRDAGSEIPNDLSVIASSLENKQNALVLFRSRREVVQASSFFLSSGVAHRLRMSGVPSAIQPWIARVFSDFTESVIGEEEFRSRFASRCAPVASHEVSQDTAWNLVRRLAGGKRGSLDVTKLRTVLSRSKVPVEICFVDGSPLGPILGTIHASKGREADDVYVLLPAVTEKGDAEEESRVLYVAATRAKKKLLAGKAMRAYGARLEGSGRCFRIATTRAKAWLEVGLEGDVHEAMTVSQRLFSWPDDVTRAQQALWENRTVVRSLAAECTSSGHEYRLAFTARRGGDAGSPFLGSLSRRVWDDASEIAKRAGGRYPGRGLLFVYSVGACSAVISPDSRELEHIHEPWCQSGFFLLPIIRGYASVFVNGR